MKNPCRTCDIFARGEGYNDNHCLKCNKRMAYVGAMGPMVASLPDELMDITNPVEARPDSGGGGGDGVPGGFKSHLFIDQEYQETEDLDMDIITEKICPRKECKHAGRPQHVEKFGRNATAKDGLQVWCKACNREANRERYKKRKKKTSGDKAAAGQVRNKTGYSGKVGTNDLLDDLFAGHQDLQDKLNNLAAAEMRTPRNQLLYMVKEA